MKKIIVVVLIVGVLYAAWHFTGSLKGESMSHMGAMPVGVAKVIVKDINEWDEFSGRLEAVDRVEIRPRIAGTIDSIHFTEGRMVKKGEPLFTIDPKPYEATLQAAKAAAAYANAEWQRARQLMPSHAISRQDYDNKRSAAVNANAMLTKAQLDLGYTQIAAPVPGRVNRAEITVGNLVNGGGDAPVLTTIVSLDPIYASFDVDEQNYVRYLHANGDAMAKMASIPVKLALSGDTDFKYEGHIKTFDNELDTKSGTVRARAVLDNKTGALIPGLYARVRVSGTGKHNAILISERAIVTDQNRKLVYVIGPDNKAEAREVMLGPVIDDLRVITSGLQEGDSIVVSGLQRVRPGAPVVPQPAPMEPEEEKK